MDENTTQDMQEVELSQDSGEKDVVEDSDSSVSSELPVDDSTDCFTLVGLTSEVVTQHYGIVEMRLENLEVLGICISVGIGLLVGMLATKSFFDFTR